MADNSSFVNINVVLTKRQKCAGCIDIRDPNWVAPTKNFFIESDNNLRKYVEDNSDLTILEIANQKLPKLTRDSITDLPTVEEIRIDSCDLQEIEPGSFRNLPNLQTINLQNNRLKIIKNGVFTNLEIISLTLDNNHIDTIEDQAFNNTKLKYLYLQNNQLKKWNSDWFNGTPLNSMFISHNLIEELPADSFKFLTTIDKDTKVPHEKKQASFLIDFSDNKINKIENGAFNYTESVGSLNLRNNQLERLQNGIFHGIKYLASLHLDYNKIHHVGEEIFEKDARVTSIALENNQLSSFPLPLLKTTVHYLQIDNNPVSRQWIQSVEEWMSNKDGDYPHPSFSPAIPRLDEIKRNCVD